MRGARANTNPAHGEWGREREREREGGGGGGRLIQLLVRFF